MDIFGYTAVVWKETEGYVKAVDAKKEMLISLGATMRKEMDGAPSM